MTDPTSRQAMADLYAGQGWPADGDELLGRSLQPRSPDMLLDAPAATRSRSRSATAAGWSGWTSS